MASSAAPTGCCACTLTSSRPCSAAARGQESVHPERAQPAHRTLFLADTYVTLDPTPEQVVEMTLLSAEEMRRFGVEPASRCFRTRAFWCRRSPTAEKMRTALTMLHRDHPELDVEGEMHGDAALDGATAAADLPP